MPLTRAQKTALKRDGFVLLRGALPKAKAAAAVAAIDAVLASKSRNEKPGEGMDREALSGYNSPFWRELVRTPAIAGLNDELLPLVESLLGKGNARPHSPPQVALRFPEGRPRALELHVDMLHGETLEKELASCFSLTVGYLLSDVTKEGMGNFTVVPGSHLALAEWYRANPPVSLREGLPYGLKLAEPVQITGRAGDVILCHYQTAHDRVGNESDTTRYMIFQRYKHAARDSRVLEGFKDPWLDWPGLAEKEAARAR